MLMKLMMPMMPMMVKDEAVECGWVGFLDLIPLRMIMIKVPLWVNMMPMM